MRYLLLRLIINAIGLYAATQINIPGLYFEGTWTTLFIVAFIFGLVNALVRPFITFLTCPLLILTLGLFTFIINALMLAITGGIANEWFHLGFTVDGFSAAFLGALVVTVVSFVLTLVLGGDDRPRYRRDDMPRRI
jgi:putative membrane protein